MQKFTAWTLAIGVAIILAASYLLDGPSDHEAAQASSGSLQDAKQAARDAKRERTIEEVMHGYAALGDAK